MKINVQTLMAVVALAMFTVSTAQVQAQDYLFLYRTNNGTITITGYTGSGGQVVVPAEITGLPVTSIGDGAFLYCLSLTSITIPDSVTSIGDEAFSGCYGLTTIAIPDSVTSIGDEAFSHCTSLTAISVGPENPAYSSLDGVLFNKNQTALIQYPGGKPGSYTIPGSVTSIGDEAFFYCTSLTSITIPNSVTSIGGFAFCYCLSLTSITIPDSVTNIGDYAFRSCTSLTNLVLGNGLTTIAGWAFLNCDNLTSVTIPDSVTSIGEEAFGGTGLANVVIGNGVTSIGFWAFSYCTDLRRVCFLGNAPKSGGDTLLYTPATVYYLPGTIGWGETFDTRPTALWVLPYPVILATHPYFGIQTNQFAFVISWAKNLPLVVEASTNLDNATWLPLSTNTLTGGTFNFSDPNWSNYPSRFYRVRSP